MSKQLYSEDECRGIEWAANVVATDLERIDPWNIFPVYGSYSSEFDDVALKTLENLLAGTFEDKGVEYEIFREILCKKNLCDYGTSPRVCFPTTQFKEQLPKYITKWKQYYKTQWES